jgi:nucleoside 2-deoxyribosyltransferase
MKVQICHNPNDGPFVERLTERLWSIGVDPRRDYLKQPGAAGGPALDHELRKYDFLLTILSPAFLEDDWLSKEVIQGMLREQTTGQPFVVPILARRCDVPSWLPRPPIDFTTSEFDAAFKELATYLATPRQGFVVMKLGDRLLDATYELVIRPVLQEFNISAMRIDQVEDSGVITDQILQHIERSALVLADLTGERPNCYFEVGYAHALGKEMILTIRKGEKIHFDMAGRRFIEWESDVDLRDKLRRRLEALKEISGK